MPDLNQKPNIKNNNPNKIVKEEISPNEKRIRELTLMYYSRADVRKALYEFSKNRECIPRYFEGFGRRPDSFQYENDILEYVRRGGTSFHCSEEIWSDPLQISTDLSKEDFNDLRIGWDLLLDIDSKYLEYSKIYAEILINELKRQGIENIGVKFSGSKGFHIIIPWKAFPKEVYGQKTKDMFPEWPRLICQYLSAILQPKLENEIVKMIDFKDVAKNTGKTEEELLVTECNLCKRSAIKKELVTWVCPNCSNELVMIRKNKRVPKCPNDRCRKEMEESLVKDIFACEYCDVNSYKNPEFFGSTKNIGFDQRVITKERYRTEEHIEADLVLVAPRHLFRMPYSLHEKTSLSSIVIDKDKIRTFDMSEARHLKVKVLDYYPDSHPEEAKNLLLRALDWSEQKEKDENVLQERKDSFEPAKEKPKTEKGKEKGPMQKIIIENPSNDIFPPCIKLLLNGVKQDGRKRGLFILMNFFTSLGVSEKEIEKRIFEWNDKNYMPLKKGYIQSQFSWYKGRSLMPPNCEKPNYRDLTVCKPDDLCKIIKNPVNYAIKKHLRR